MARKRGRARPFGIYAAEEQVFRFYPDGVVLDVLVKPAPRPAEGQAIAAWLHRKASAPLSGVYLAHYEFSEGFISFTTRSHFRDEAIDVCGRWSVDRLILDRRDAGRLQTGLHFLRIWPT
ncbi:hypothetical protein [Streptosporangium sp. NBC_01756]|uniref:hypothetical protein n=1 Tax=Streptosporangium sp. NBC_01756 TaxID=2975950 RepID=UPI002DDBAE0E|nr:hypothetical protein [Streptosporangium sp. NBC_01756]WSC83255.1 hypothetical protein OIE48_22860 [Streptosporangium sp. NBC_01756]